MSKEQEKIEEGIAAIKSEFIVPDHIPTLTLDCVSAKDQHKILDSGEPSSKKPKWSKRNKNNVLKGQNKSRGPTYTQEKQTALCPKLIDIAPDEENLVCMHNDCKFMHDVELFLTSKPPDIADECYVFSTKGYCPRGITCRFGKSHITSDGRNIRKYDAHDELSHNFLTKELQNSLRKRSYDFKKSESILAKLDKRKEEIKADGGFIKESNKRLGCVDDSDLIPLKIEEKKKIDWNNKLFLSPLTTVGNLPFRRICKEFGADVTCGEMALASSLLQGSEHN